MCVCMCVCVCKQNKESFKKRFKNLKCLNADSRSVNKLKRIKISAS